MWALSGFPIGVKLFESVGPWTRLFAAIPVIYFTYVLGSPSLTFPKPADLLQVQVPDSTISIFLLCATFVVIWPIIADVLKQIGLKIFGKVVLPHERVLGMFAQGFETVRDPSLGLDHTCAVGCASLYYIFEKMFETRSDKPKIEVDIYRIECDRKGNFGVLNHPGTSDLLVGMSRGTFDGLFKVANPLKKLLEPFNPSAQIAAGEPFKKRIPIVVREDSDFECLFKANEGYAWNLEDRSYLMAIVAAPLKATHAGEHEARNVDVDLPFVVVCVTAPRFVLNNGDTDTFLRLINMASLPLIHQFLAEYREPEVVPEVNPAGTQWAFDPAKQQAAHPVQEEKS